jgi:hypothetical protein
MRAPTFKSVLESFRDSRRGPPKEVLEAWAKIDWHKRHATPAAERDPLPPPLVGNRNSADTELLNSWIGDDRAEEVWQVIRTHAPGLMPETLIQKVLDLRRTAGASVNRICGVPAQEPDPAKYPDPEVRAAVRAARLPVLPGYKADWAAHVSVLKDLEMWIRDLLRVAPSAPDPLEAAEDLEWLQELRSATQEFTWAVEDIGGLHRQYLGDRYQVTFRLSREGSNDRKKRVAFLQLMTDFLEECCHLKLRWEVGVLCEIAFPGEELDQDKVRAALRRRRRRRESA